ncbi:MAG: hypothetical protein IAF58_20175 [Leptolyngbya sp.]|nr:hypothetical protein [Candidatus Melainabacteria bacterium]
MQSKWSFAESAATFSAILLCMSPALADSYSDGAAQYSAGNYSGAKIHLMKATVAKPKSWQAHYQLANTLVALKDSASAKRSYSKCLACNPPADIRENCQRAIIYMNSNPKLAAPAAAQVSLRSYSSGKGDSSAHDTGSSPSINVESRRSQVLVETEADIVKMKEQEKHRLEEMHNNANETWIHPDGAIKQGLSPEAEKAFNKEVEEKAAAMREQGKRRAASFR